jgi:hypothetical protein
MAGITTGFAGVLILWWITYWHTIEVLSSAFKLLFQQAS